MSILIPEKRYLCIGNDKVRAEWLPRWYGVPHDECIFRAYPNEPVYWRVNFIVLKPLPLGSDYKKQLCILKTEKLLWQ